MKNNRKQCTHIFSLAHTALDTCLAGPTLAYALLQLGHSWHIYTIALTYILIFYGALALRALCSTLSAAYFLINAYCMGYLLASTILVPFKVTPIFVATMLRITRGLPNALNRNIRNTSTYVWGDIASGIWVEKTFSTKELQTQSPLHMMHPWTGHWGTLLTP